MASNRGSALLNSEFNHAAHDTGDVYHVMFDFDRVLTNNQRNKKYPNVSIERFIVEDNIELLNLFIKPLQIVNALQPIAAVIISSGTNRQDYMNDVLQNNKVSSVSTYEIFSDFFKKQLNEIQVFHDVFTLPDATHHAGYNYEKRLKDFENNPNLYHDEENFRNLYYDKLDEDKKKFPCFPFDKYKIPLLYLQTQRESLLHPKQTVHIYFIDDQESILKKIREFFADNLSRLPENVHLSLYHYDKDNNNNTVTLSAIFHGEGKPDEQCVPFLSFVANKKKDIDNNFEKNWQNDWDKLRKEFENRCNDQSDQKDQNNQKKNPDLNCISKSCYPPGEFLKEHGIHDDIFSNWCQSHNTLIDNREITDECHPVAFAPQCFNLSPFHKKNYDQFSQCAKNISDNLLFHIFTMIHPDFFNTKDSIKKLLNAFNSTMIKYRLNPDDPIINAFAITQDINQPKKNKNDGTRSSSFNLFNYFKSKFNRETPPDTSTQELPSPSCKK